MYVRPSESLQGTKIQTMSPPSLYADP